MMPIETSQRIPGSVAEFPEICMSPQIAADGLPQKRHSVLDLIGAGVLTVAQESESDFTIRAVNDRAAELLHLSSGTARQTLQDALPDEFAGRLLDSLRTCTATGEVIELEMLTAPSAEDRWMRLALVPRMGRKGAQPIVVIMVTDITGRKRAEFQSLAWELRFRSLVEECIQGVLVVRQDRVLFCNPAFLAMFGFATSAEAYRLARVSALIHEDDRDVLLQDPAEWAQTRFEGRHRVIRATRRSGEPIWIEASGGELLWDKEPAIQLTILDVTDRMVAEEALRRCSERHQTLPKEIAQPVVLGVTPRSP
jgi:PAS domain S-box-containing protein